jgi:hypothetical protein
MAMTSMKTDDDRDCYPCPSNPWGYGLTISLTEDQVEALGLKNNPPPAGSTVGIQAIAIVTSVTQDADIDGVSGDGDNDGVDVTLRFQITDMEVTGASTGPAPATMLYGE